MAKLLIDDNECIGCNLCVELCPDLFIPTYFVPIPTDMDVQDIQCAYDSVIFCPTEAISIV